MVTLAAGLAQVKDELPQLLSGHVSEYLARQNHWDWRHRIFDPLTTLMLFVLQVLHGNTAIAHLPHLAGMRFTPTAYCNARGRLPLGLFEHVAAAVTADLLPESDHACRWRGHRVWRADATSFSMPDTAELQARFGQPGGQKPGCGFPVATLLTLCNAAGLIVKTLALPLRAHEAAHVADLHQALAPGDVLVYDRAGCSYTHLALLAPRGLHAVLRVHQKQIVDFRPGRKHAGRCPKGQRTGRPKSQWLKRLGKHDQLVRWFKPKRRPKWMSQADYDALPDALVLRELRYSARRKGFRSKSITLVTTLGDPQAYPARELADQYLGRWRIEVDFRHLKTTMGMDVLKCQSVEGVRKEVAVFTLVYNLVRLVMLRAASRQGVSVERVSFVDALRWLRDARGAQGVADLLVNPSRNGRVEPRVIKRRMKQYDLMKRPREELRKALQAESRAA
jgi:hypothetical protein